MESPQSSHSSSLWVFALSTVESYRPLHPVPISHLGTKLYSTVLLLFGLRVISSCVLALAFACVSGWHELQVVMVMTLKLLESHVNFPMHCTPCVHLHLAMHCHAPRMCCSLTLCISWPAAGGTSHDSCCIHYYVFGVFFDEVTI